MVLQAIVEQLLRPFAAVSVKQPFPALSTPAPDNLAAPYSKASIAGHPPPHSPCGDKTDSPPTKSPQDVLQPVPLQYPLLASLLRNTKTVIPPVLPETKKPRPPPYRPRVRRSSRKVSQRKRQQCVKASNRYREKKRREEVESVEEHQLLLDLRAELLERRKRLRNKIKMVVGLLQKRLLDVR